MTDRRLIDRLLHETPLCVQRGVLLSLKYIKNRAQAVRNEKTL